MIDITPYQERLEWLKEWIHKRIDGFPTFYIDIEAVPKINSMEKFIEIYTQTGIMFYTKNEISQHNLVMPVSFDEYCQYKQRNK